MLEISSENSFNAFEKFGFLSQKLLPGGGGGIKAELNITMYAIPFCLDNEKQSKMKLDAKSSLPQLR